MTISIWLLLIIIAATILLTFLILRASIGKNNIRLSKEISEFKKASEKANKKSEKLLKTNKKLEQKNANLAEQHQNQISELTNDLQEKRSSVLSLESELKNLTAEKESATNQLQKMESALSKSKEELQKQIEKYQKDLHDSKNWKSIKTNLEKDLSAKIHQIEELSAQNGKLSAKLKSQEADIMENAKMRKKQRLLETEVKKGKKDLAYWEQKHYDVHHDLSVLKEAYIKLKGTSEELQEKLNGEAVIHQNMMESLKEFKTKFVQVNNQYHELLEQVNQN